MSAAILALIAALLFSVVGCATNPVTGKRELALVSSSQEVRMGREGAEGVVRSIGLYDDPALQEYVSRLGLKLAAKSERPELPWSFQVVDDAAVNAFALPGGFIFLTRGILAHLNSEAQLVAVLGHEIGHVTARHSVQQISRAQLASLGLGIGFIVSDEFREFAPLAASGVGLLFLKFGRDDELQADELGFAYALQNHYDAREMVPVFRTLEGVSDVSSSERLPQWQSTHPDPGTRIEQAQARVRAASLTSASHLRVGRDDYLNRINGITFGDDPRKGYFKGPVFSHPDLKFRLTFPEGWTTHNGVSAVVAMSPEKDAAVELTLVEDDTPSNLASKFFTQPGMIADAPSTEPVNGLPAAMARFELAKGGGVLTGRALFITLGETTYRILGYGSAEQERYHAEAMLRSLLSFRRLTDRAALAVQAATVRTVAIGQPMTIEEFYERHPSSVPLETVALINGTRPGTRLATGTRLKQVRGGKLPD